MHTQQSVFLWASTNKIKQSLSLADENKSKEIPPGKHLVKVEFFSNLSFHVHRQDEARTAHTGLPTLCTKERCTLGMYPTAFTQFHSNINKSLITLSLLI